MYKTVNEVRVISKSKSVKGLNGLEQPTKAMHLDELNFKMQTAWKKQTFFLI